MTWLSDNDNCKLDGGGLDIHEVSSLSHDADNNDNDIAKLFMDPLDCLESLLWNH